MKKYNAREYASASKSEKEEYKTKNEEFYVDRIIDIAEALDLKVSAVSEKSKSIDDKNGYQIGQKTFGIEDTLQDLDEYVSLIKKSDKYKKYLKKNK